MEYFNEIIPSSPGDNDRLAFKPWLKLNCVYPGALGPVAGTT
jgi:hypothetical protein